MIALTVALAVGVQSDSRACDVRSPTPATGPGPHDYSFASETSDLWHDGDEGEPLFLRARVLDTCGKPLSGAHIQILHANQDGEHVADRWRARLRSDNRGEFKVTTVYPGYAGSIARHIHFIVSHPGYEELVTRLFFKNDPATGLDLEELTVVLDEVRRGDVWGWVGGYEFVLAPK